jgi:hypothetical protein
VCAGRLSARTCRAALLAAEKKSSHGNQVIGCDGDDIAGTRNAAVGQLMPSQVKAALARSHDWWRSRLRGRTNHLQKACPRPGRRLPYGNGITASLFAHGINSIAIIHWPTALRFLTLKRAPTRRTAVPYLPNGCAIDRFHGQLRLHCNQLPRAWVRFAQKTNQEIRAISMAGSLAIAAIARNGEMGRQSIAEANGT